MKQDKDRKPDSPSLAAEQIRELNLENSFYAHRVERACIKYERSLRQGRLPTRYDSDIDTQVENYRDRCIEQVLIRDRLYEMLEQVGASPFHRVLYLAFANHVNRLCRYNASLALRNKVREAVDRWTTRGLDPEALKAILLQLFDVVLPKGA